MSRPVIRFTESDRVELVGVTAIRGIPPSPSFPRWLRVAIANYVNQWDDKGPRKPVHCDELTLHRPGQCEYCDEYGAARQKFRSSEEIPFSGEPGAPDAMFRPNSTINQWGGNRPATKAELDAESAAWQKAFYEFFD